MVRLLAALLVGLTCGLVMLGTTLPKFCEMAQIKGWLPGAERRHVVVTAKRLIRETEPYAHDVYWVAWNGASAGVRSDSRVNLDREEWQRLVVGDRLEVIRIGWTGRVYTPGTVYVSFGNAVFDLVLFLVEASGVYLAFATVGDWRARRRRVRARTAAGVPAGSAATRPPPPDAG